MGDMKLQGSQGMFYGNTDVKSLRLKQGTTLEQVKAATHDNNLDEVVLKDVRGQLHVAYADELSVKDGKMPKEGDVVTVDFVEGAAEVVHVDDEWNEDFYTGPISRFFNSKILDGDDTQLQALKAQYQSVSQTDLDWARDIENKVMTEGYQPSESEISRYGKIADALNAEVKNKST